MNEFNLWSGVVGSHMWGMQHEDSDTDLFEVYALDTKSILTGAVRKGTFSQKGRIDKHRYEIGHVVKELQKGNINFLWGVTTPINAYFHRKAESIHTKLREIVLNNISKNYCHAVKGMTVNNLKKYFNIKYEDGILIDRGFYGKTQYGSKKWNKKCLLIYRTIMFGRNLLKGEINYNIKRVPISLTLIFHMFYALIKEYEDCELPEKPNNEVFDEFLYETRLEFL